MPYLCKKEKGNDKNFHLKKKSQPELQHPADFAGPVCINCD